MTADSADYPVLRRGDHVAMDGFDELGVVVRVARDRRWADVKWTQWSPKVGRLTWTKRQPDTRLLHRVFD